MYFCKVLGKSYMAASILFYRLNLKALKIKSIEYT